MIWRRNPQQEILRNNDGGLANNTEFILNSNEAYRRGEVVNVLLIK